MEGLDYDSSSDEESVKQIIPKAVSEVRKIGPDPPADKQSRKREASPEIGEANEANKKSKNALASVKSFKPPQVGKGKGKGKGNVVTEQIFRKKS